MFPGVAVSGAGAAGAGSAPGRQEAAGEAGSGSGARRVVRRGRSLHANTSHTRALTRPHAHLIQQIKSRSEDLLGFKKRAATFTSGTSSDEDLLQKSSFCGWEPEAPSR